jgi:hypothetical protein
MESGHYLIMDLYYANRSIHVCFATTYVAVHCTYTDAMRTFTSYIWCLYDAAASEISQLHVCCAVIQLQ